MTKHEAPNTKHGDPHATRHTPHDAPRAFAFSRILALLVLIAAACVYVGPFAWLVTTSMKTSSEAAKVPPILVPVGSDDVEGMTRRDIPADSPALTQRWLITKYNYQKVLTDPAFDFQLCGRNTLLIASGVVIGSIISSSLVAFSLAKLRWRGRNLLFGVILATMMLPFTVLMIPQYVIYKDLGWIGTNLPLWFPSFLGVPFYIFLLRQFYITIPDELLDAARMDGCSEFRIWWQIMVPLSRPALAVVALFSFLAAWNDFLGPLVYLVHKQQFTLSLALQFFQSRSGGTAWELLMAASTLVITPVVVLFFLAQRTFIQGIATTGMKG